MSELKDHWEYENGPIVMRRKVYYKSDVDAVIAEKDRALEYAKALTLKDIEIIKEKDKEIAELKAKLESEKESRYADSVDAGMRERRLKRALWLARARTAYLEFRLFVKDSVHTDDNIEANKAERMAIKWQKVERKCRSKAEEFGG